MCTARFAELTTSEILNLTQEREFFLRQVASQSFIQLAEAWFVSTSP